MKLNEAFPSNFLKADDLNGKQCTMTIESAEVEEIGQGNEKASKLVLAFRGAEKKLVCNVTNAKTIAKVLGTDETDDWIGKEIRITPVASTKLDKTPTKIIGISIPKAKK